MEKTNLLEQAETILHQAKTISNSLAFTNEDRDITTRRIHALTELAGKYIDLYKTQELR